MADLRCAECGRQAYPHLGWEIDDPAYCADHAALLGRDPRYVIPAAINDAVGDMLQPASDFATWSLPSLHAMLGYILPGTVTYGAAFPKNGKTAFVAAQIAHWEREGIRPWVMPTEARPKGLMTRIACARLGLSVDDVMSRRLRARMDAGDDLAREQFLDLLEMFNTMLSEHEKEGASLAIEPAPRLTRKVFQQSIHAAAAGGFGIVVVDHVDHVGGDMEGESGYQASEGVQYDALKFAEQYNIAVVLMTQFNTSRVHHDPLYRYRRPITDWLWMKGVKDQIAATMFGLYRPMKPDLDDKTLAAAKSGEVESWQVAMPHTMGVVSMLARYAGERPDQAVFLDYHDGQISERQRVDQWSDAAAQHGIRTTQDYLRGMA